MSKDKYSIQYEELFRTYFTSLCYFAQKYIKDLDSCKEIVHKIFVNIWEKREEFDFEKSAKSYLFTAVYNRCINHIRDQKKFVSDGTLDAFEEFNSITVNSDHLEAAELETRIWKIINELPKGCRDIFVLNRFDGKKYAEIADELNISVKTVETQMTKALKILRDNLKDYLHLFIIFILKSLW
jgi:RNA polymerase sigma-70 factor, ECF subfamily